MASRFNPARDCVDMKPFIACYASFFLAGRTAGSRINDGLGIALPAHRDRPRLGNNVESPASPA